MNGFSALEIGDVVDPVVNGSRRCYGWSDPLGHDQ